MCEAFQHFISFRLSLFCASPKRTQYAVHEVMYFLLAFAVQLSMIVGYPFTIQHIREAIPRHAWRHPHVNTGAYITTAVFVVTFTSSTLLYLVRHIDHCWDVMCCNHGGVTMQMHGRR